ncbi:GNAT family N-acetyltransferase [Streptomyces collinus]|uniref:GNAT family N-acetyltransferase n=1 Tax=Streptomyces collinus TaxID=42684 RepID=UPI0036EB4038
MAEARVVGDFWVRVMEPDDHTTVLTLINADRLPGQPAAGPGLLTSPPDDGLALPTTLVLTDLTGTVCGVVHCAVRTRDGAGLIGWLHARENFDAAVALIAAARAHLGPARMLYAGTGPTQASQPGTLPLPGIAQRRRPATTRALHAAGFTEAATRLYLVHPLTPAPAAPVFPLAKLRPEINPAGVQLTLVETDGQPMATAVLHPLDDEHWQLRHLAVREDRRHRGIASHLLAQCLYTAHTRGATSLTAHIDENDHISARLLQHAGFTDVDTLTIHHRRP